MFVKEITYTNFNDEEITRKYYFNLSKSDITQWNLEKNGGFLGRLERIQNTMNGVEIAEFIEELLSKTYGEKSDDGNRFIKHRPDGSRLYDEFKETNAYDVLYMELTSDEKKAAEFINGVLPKDMIKNMKNLESGSTVSNLPSSNN